MTVSGVDQILVDLVADHPPVAFECERGQLFESDGMAIKRNYYDDTHLLFGIALLDAQERPARYSACFTGVDCPPGNQDWHAVRIVRSPDGRATYNHYFDADGEKIMTLDCKTQQCWGVD